MTIKCASCHVYLGEVHDAKLKKGIVFLCKECENKRIGAELLQRHKEPKQSNPLGDLFGGIFK